MLKKITSTAFLVFCLLLLVNWVEREKGINLEKYHDILGFLIIADAVIFFAAALWVVWGDAV